MEYRTGDRRAYFDALYEHIATDTELPNPADDGANIVFVTAGFATDGLTLGFAYRHEINNDNLDYHQGMVNSDWTFYAATPAFAAPPR